MIEPRIIPCLLLEGETLVKTVRFADPVYVGDPVNVLSIFNSFEVDEIVLLDIAGARRRTPAGEALLAHLAEECFIPLAYGGGLTSADQMASVLQIGFEKVVLSTALHEHPAEVARAVERFGSQAVVAALDVRGDGEHATVWTRGAQVDTGRHPVERAQELVELGVGEILLTSVDREGTMAGLDLELIRSVAGAVPVPVVAHGGAGKRAQLPEAIAAGAAAVAAGSLFVFQGSQRGVLINYPTRSQIVRLLSGSTAHDRT